MRGRAGTWEQGPGADGTAASRSCSALPLRMDRVSPARRGARAAEAPVLGLVPNRESERAQESASALRAQATTRNEREGWHVGAGAWRRRNGGLSLVQCPSIAYGPSVASAARRARGGSARAGPRPPERASERRRARARYARKPPRAMRGRAGTWEQGPGADGTAASRSCSALPLRMDRVSPARRGARAAEAPVLGLVPNRESERAQESASALRAQATTRNEREGWHVGARAWRRRNGGLSLVQCPSIAYGPSVASAARRARGGSARAGPRPYQRERASAGERERATRASHHAQ